VDSVTTLSAVIQQQTGGVLFAGPVRDPR